MNGRHFKYGLLTALALAVFVFLSLQSQRVNEEVNNQYGSDLRQLDGLQATLNEEVLRSRLGLLTYFDPLNTTLSDLESIRNRLGAIPSFIGDQERQELDESLAKYDELMQQKRDLVESFKTQNAVLINSLSYFTIVVSDVTNTTTGRDVKPAVVGTLNSLLQNVLLYNVTANKELIPVVRDYLSQLPPTQADLTAALSSDTVDLDALVNHTNLILEGKPATDTLINDMFALPISQQITDISGLYSASYLVARQGANLYQVALYLFSLIVIGYISASIIMRMRKSAAVLGSAQAELQTTYTSLEKRTHELELVNNELQRASQEAREANRLKDEFLAVMSHELRTPLNAIIGFQGILLMTGTIDERATHMIQRAQANADRLLSLINDILDISRIESGRLQLAPIDLPITETIEKWRSQMSVLAEQKGVNFSVHVDEAFPSVIWVDEDAVTKIVTNLLGNAFKFTEQGEVSLGLKRSNGSWTIEVSDTGIGIPAHMQNIIFERFRQVDGSSKRKYGGSGLGLAIVQNLCKAMKGSIVVNSVPGEGSTFIVTLPLENVQAERENYG